MTGFGVVTVKEIIIAGGCDKETAMGQFLSVYGKDDEMVLR